MATPSNIINPKENPFKARYATYDVSVDKKKWKAFLAVFLGTMMERYDYALYGHMSALLTGHFFPTKDPAVAMVQHFGVFALGFLTKPLGAYIFGSIGDKKGRKYALRWSIVGIVVPTFLIGLLPSYAQWGFFSPVLLIMCRMAQGTFVSAEYDGAEIFVYETISKRFSCFSGGIFQMSSIIGSTIASYIVGVTAKHWMPIWAWRMPFLVAGMFGALVFYYRRHLVESYDYIRYRNNSYQEKPQSFLSILVKNRSATLVSFFLTGSMGGVTYFYLYFWSHYLCKNLNIITVQEACFRVVALGVVSFFASPIIGFISDYFRPITSVRFTIIISIMMILLNGIALYYDQLTTTLSCITMVWLIAYQIPGQILRLKLFSTGERYRCMSMGHALGGMALSSTAPLIGASLWKIYQNPIAPLACPLGLLLMGFAVTFFAKPKLEPRVTNYAAKGTLNDKELEAFVDSEPMIEVNKPTWAARVSDYFRNTYSSEYTSDIHQPSETSNIYQFPPPPKKSTKK